MLGLGFGLEGKCLALALKAQALALNIKASGSASGLGFAESAALAVALALYLLALLASLVKYMISNFKLTALLIDFQVDGQMTLESNVSEVGDLRIAYTVSGRKSNTELSLLTFLSVANYCFRRQFHSGIFLMIQRRRGRIFC